MKIYELRAKIGSTLFTQSFATSEAALLKAYSIRNKCTVGGCNFAGHITPQTANERGEKTMRTKTPKQIHEQWFKIKPRFNGNRALHMKYVRIYHVYRANMENYGAEWTTPVPASVYTKQA